MLPDKSYSQAFLPNGDVCLELALSIRSGAVVLLPRSCLEHIENLFFFPLPNEG